MKRTSFEEAVGILDSFGMMVFKNLTSGGYDIYSKGTNGWFTGAHLLHCKNGFEVVHNAKSVDTANFSENATAWNLVRTGKAEEMYQLSAKASKLEYEAEATRNKIKRILL